MFDGSQPLHLVVGMRRGGHDLDLGAMFAKCPTDAHKRAASAETRYEHIDFRHIPDYFRPGGGVMGIGIGAISVLIWHEPRWVLMRHLFGDID